MQQGMLRTFGRIMPVLMTLCFLFAVLIGAASSAYAQFETATVLGSVRDANGAIIPGAKVSLKNTATGITASAMTDEEGNYQFFNVKTNFRQPNGNASNISRDAGGNPIPGGLHGTIRSALPARQIQFALKFLY